MTSNISTDEQAIRIRPFDISRHCLEGGTFVTNFEGDDIWLYRDTVRAFGEPRLIVHDERKGSLWPTGGSLHYLGDEPGNGSWNDATWGPGFWRTMEGLQGRHKEWLWLRRFAP